MSREELTKHPYTRKRETLPPPVGEPQSRSQDSRNMHVRRKRVEEQFDARGKTVEEGGDGEVAEDVDCAPRCRAAEEMGRNGVVELLGREVRWGEGTLRNALFVLRAVAEDLVPQHDRRWWMSGEEEGSGGEEGRYEGLPAQQTSPYIRRRVGHHLDLRRRRTTANP